MIAPPPSAVQPRFAADFYDVPNQPSTVPLALDSVCVDHQQVLLHVAEDLLDGTMPVLCDVEARVSLRRDQRGIHMSRIEHAFQTGTERPLVEHAIAIARQIKETQQQQTAEVRLTARVPYVTHTRMTGLASPDTVEIWAAATAGPVPTAGLALAATTISACPCMQGYSLTDLVNVLGISPEQGLDLLGRVPIATHSQRGRVRLAVLAPGPDDLPDYRHLYEVLAAHTTLTQELLKRPDEYDLVRRAHLAPQFVEDTVRQVTRGAVGSLVEHGHDLERLQLHVTADSHESIHGHDIHASLLAPASELAAMLGLTAVKALASP